MFYLKIAFIVIYIKPIMKLLSLFLLVHSRLLSLFHCPHISPFHFHLGLAIFLCGFHLPHIISGIYSFILHKCCKFSADLLSQIYSYTLNGFVTCPVILHFLTITASRCLHVGPSVIIVLN